MENLCKEAFLKKMNDLGECANLLGSERVYIQTKDLIRLVKMIENGGEELKSVLEISGPGEKGWRPVNLSYYPYLAEAVLLAGENRNREALESAGKNYRNMLARKDKTEDKYKMAFRVQVSGGKGCQYVDPEKERVMESLCE